MKENRNKWPQAATVSNGEAPLYSHLESVKVVGRKRRRGGKAAAQLEVFHSIYPPYKHHETLSSLIFVSGWSLLRERKEKMQPSGRERGREGLTLHKITLGYLFPSPLRQNSGIGEKEQPTARRDGRPNLTHIEAAEAEEPVLHQ